MRIRQGRRNPRNLYIQTGDDPSEQDISIGYIRFPATAAYLVERMNFSSAGSPIQKAVLEELKGQS